MGKFRKKIIMIGCLVTLLIGAIFFYCSNDKREGLTYDKNNTIAIYLEDTTSSDGYKLSNSKVFPKKGYVLNTSKSSCTNGGSLSQDENNKISLQISSSDSCVLYFDKINAQTTLKALNIKMQDGAPNFAETATTDETKDGLYSMIDDSGELSYYYRGAVENNYVKFGIDKDGNDMYWRIIRFNGDGSMRMQYDGKANGHSDTDFTYTQGHALNQAWTVSSADNRYVGYMHGSICTTKDNCQNNRTNSWAKNVLEQWYEENLYVNYNDYIVDEIFCNDRSFIGNGGKLTEYTLYMPLYRANNNKPQFICPQDNDKFTVNVDSGGNGMLKYPVGLITSDEVQAAGGLNTKANEKYYLKKDKWYVTFSPCDFSGGYAHIYGVDTDGKIVYAGTSWQETMISPVINIGSEYMSQLVGNGSANNPFRFENTSLH